MKRKPSTDETPAKAASKINPALEPLARPTASLRLDDRNARKHERRSIDTIKTSLATYGQQKPIVALTSGTVIAGNGTLEAARELGWEKIAVVTFDTEDEARARAFAVMDNRSAELSDWNNEQLLTTLQTFDEQFLNATGFDADFVDRMLKRQHVEFDTSSQLNTMQFRVIVENLDETQQLKLIEELESKGYRCKAMMM